MAYTKQTWTDGDTSKPVSAARMQHIEDGLDAVANGGSIPFPSPIPTTANIEALYPGGYICAHRGGAGIFPENTLEAMRWAVAAGVPSINFDCYLVADGKLTCFHDTTIDRCTDGSGNTDSQTALSMQDVNVDPGTFIGGWSRTMRVPTVDQVLTEFGGKVHMVVEAINTGSGTPVANKIAQYGLGQFCIVESRTLSELARAVTLGIPAMLIDDTGATSASSIVAAGVKYVAVKSSALKGGGASASAVQAYLDAGLKVHVYTISRFSDMLPYAGKAISAWHADEPVYLNGDTSKYRMSTDPFAVGKWGHGMVPSASNSNVATGGGYTTSFGSSQGNFSRGAISSGKLAMGPNLLGWVLQGWNCPVPSPSGTYSITFTAKVEVAGTDTSRWAGIFVCCPTDVDFNDGNPATYNNDGYMFLIRETGALEAYTITAGVKSSGPTQSTAAISGGGTAVIRIDVTPTTVKATRTDVGSPNSVTISDTGHRGAYWHFGVGDGTNGAEWSFGSVTGP